MDYQCMPIPETENAFEENNERYSKYKTLSNKKLSKILIFVIGMYLGGWTLYWYQQLSADADISTEKFEEDIIAVNSTVKENFLQLQFPLSCTSSSENIGNNTCEELYIDNYAAEGWITADAVCYKEFVSFDFKKNIYLEFVVLENFEANSMFLKYDKIKDYKILFPESSFAPMEATLEITNEHSQWIDINKEISKITFEIKSSYEDPSESQCGLQEISFYGRDT